MEYNVSTLKTNTIQAATGSTVSLASGHKIDGALGQIQVPGAVTQFVSNLVNTEVSVTSNTDTSTGCTVTISPTDSNNGIFIGVQGVLYLFGNSATSEPKTRFTLERSVGGGSYSDIKSYGDNNGYTIKHEYGANNYWETHAFYLTHTHYPGTTSEVIYRLKMANAAGTSGVSRLNSGSTNNGTTMTAMEFAR